MLYSNNCFLSFYLLNSNLPNTNAYNYIRLKSYRHVLNDLLQCQIRKWTNYLLKIKSELLYIRSFCFWNSD